MFGKSRSNDRRTVNRYDALGTITLGWRESSEFRTTGARFVDISQHGACIESQQAPPNQSPIWLLLSDGRREQWIAGSVAAVHRTWRGPYTIRLAFNEVCPYDFFRSAIGGISIQNETSIPEKEEMRDHHLWY